MRSRRHFYQSNQTDGTNKTPHKKLSRDNSNSGIVSKFAAGQKRRNEVMSKQGTNFVQSMQCSTRKYLI